MEVAFEPLEALMMVMEMGVKGSGEAESWLGKATGVESEIRGTGGKKQGGEKTPKRARQEQRARKERREGKQSRSVTGG